MSVIPSSRLGRALAAIPSRRLSSALEFDENQHPRDAHGRFGDKDDRETPAEKARKVHADGSPLSEHELRIQTAIINARLPYIPASVTADQTSIELGRMDPKLQEAVASRVEAFGKEFPVALGKVGEFRVADRADDGTMAWIEEGHWSEARAPLSVMFNASYFDDAATLAATCERCAAGDFHPIASPQSVVDHELGHVLDRQLVGGSRASTNPVWSDSERMRAEVSGYAAQSPEEAFAEAFTIRQASGIKSLDPSVAEPLAAALAERAR